MHLKNVRKERRQKKCKRNFLLDIGSRKKHSRIEKDDKHLGVRIIRIKNIKRNFSESERIEQGG